MSTRREYRVLVVDDEEPIRRLTVRALTQEGMRCDGAEDGLQAEQMLARTCYDAVVTDLRMPNRHGHALAVDLLSGDNRPLVFVQTGVLEPRLARDLFARGVDDVAFKPVDYRLLAVKLRALLIRRSARATNGDPAKMKTEGSTACPADADEAEVAKVDLAELESRLASAAKTSSISQAAIGVFDLARTNDCSAQKLAAAARHDASLVIELLRLANSSFYNASGRKVTELEEAITRLGQNRVGELALATSALAMVTAVALPWMNVGLVWRRSVAAGSAVELLTEDQEEGVRDEGLFLSTIMQGLGRVILGALYPSQYETMIAHCLRSGQPLYALEKRVFPENHAEIMARLLALWKLPSSIFHPLKYSLDGYSHMTRLPEPLRTRVELIKLASFMGQVAASEWEDWDLVEPPPASIFARLRIESVSDVIARVRADLAKLARADGGPAAASPVPRQTPAIAQQCAYANLSGLPFDFLADVLPAIGICPQAWSTENGGSGPLLVNGLASESQKLADLRRNRPGGSPTLILADEAPSGGDGQDAATVTLPCSFAALREACLKLTQPV